MRKQHGAFFCAVAVFAVVLLVLLGVMYNDAQYAVTDTVDVNRIRTILDGGEIPTKEVYDYIAIDSAGEIIAATLKTEEKSYAVRLNDAIRDGNAVVDWNGGKIIVYTGAAARFAVARSSAFSCVFVFFGLTLLLFLLETFYFDRRILRPFRKLKYFSEEVAKGNFEKPLPMDKNNNFGAFSEAFDLMRNNMLEAKREAEEAREGKRVLMAELGHDIRTPLSTILAVAELRAAEGVKGMKIVVDKAKQIDNLFTDIYSASLEDVGKLSVENVRHSATEIGELISAADAAHRVVFLNEPSEADVLYDKTRLEECADNVLSNAKKYADSSVEVTFGIQNDKLSVSFRDFGAGVTPEELAYITERFYRGKTAQGKTGAGLGLFITKNLLEKMGGGMQIANDGGLKITFLLKLC